MRPDRLELLATYDADAIQSFLATRKSEVIPPDMRDYILQLDSLAKIFHYHKNSQSRAIDELRKQWPTLTVSQAREIYRDAMEYFYQDAGVSAKAWDNKYADALDDLARAAIAAEKFATAEKAFTKAHELRTKQREQEDFHWHAPVFFININVKPEDLGYASQRLMDIARRHEDDELRKMIKGLETTDAEKIRLMNEAGIQDAQLVEETPEDDE